MNFLNQILCFMLLFSNVFYASDIRQGWCDPEEKIDYDAMHLSDETVTTSTAITQEPIHNNENAANISDESQDLNSIDILVFMSKVISYTSTFIHEIDTFLNNEDEK